MLYSVLYMGAIGQKTTYGLGLSLKIDTFIVCLQIQVSGYDIAC